MDGERAAPRIVGLICPLVVAAVSLLSAIVSLRPGVRIAWRSRCIAPIVHRMGFVFMGGLVAWPSLATNAADDVVAVNGKQKSLRDLQGRCILLHVWGKWNSSDMEAIADVQAAFSKSADRRLEYVGLNVDAESAAAKELVSGQTGSESQIYLGAGSDIECQLAFGSVPTYYLIGRDGALIGSTNEWTAMVRMIDAIDE